MAEVVALHPAPLHTLSILLVEDSASDAILIQKAIHGAMPGGGHVQCVETLEKALHTLRHQAFEVTLLDLSLPDSADFDGLLSIQNLAPKMPVVILTAYADEEMALKAVKHGAQDYLFKDKIDGKAMRRAMHYAAQRKKFEATLIAQANFDPLTGLANRVLFESRLDMALARQRRLNSGIGVFFLDLNRFKPVNDALGHATGDKLLQQVAERFRQCLRPYDTTARFGGDEFALLIEGIAQPRDCVVIAQKIISRIDQPFHLAGREVTIGVSIGIATFFPDDKCSRDALMKQADEAMYEAKLSGHSNYHFYTPEIQQQAQARMKLEHELRAALVHEELVLYYQPKISLRTGQTSGAEALVRWNHPSRGILLPGEFMAIAEETGMVKEIGEWVFHTACADIARWQKKNLPPMQVSVNLSLPQLDDASFAASLRSIFEEYHVSPAMLAVEIPSSALLQHSEGRIRLLSEIRKLGVAVHLDHFGTSAISLAALMTHPADAVKIAPEITATIHRPDGMMPLVQAIIDIAERFGIEVVATGIENKRQQEFFRRRRCREVQGFALCHPMPGERIPDWLRY